MHVLLELVHVICRQKKKRKLAFHMVELLVLEEMAPIYVCWLYYHGWWRALCSAFSWSFNKDLLQRAIVIRLAES